MKKKAKVRKFGIGGLLEAVHPLSVLEKRPLTFRTLLDPAGIFTDDNVSQDYKKKMAEKKEKEASASRGYAKGGMVRGCGCATKGKKFRGMR
jgi:hypothetical protein